jgi:membrane-associated phospholipid phosphatase
MNKIAQFISAIFQPLLFPSYGMLLLFQTGNFVYFNTQYKAYGILSVFILTAVIPFTAILILKKAKLVTSFQLEQRKERTLPYIFVILSYLATILFLYRIFMPLYVVALMVGVLISTILIMLLNLKWKVSAHLSAIGGLSAAIVVVSYRLGINPVGLLSAAFVLAGLIATSRIQLKAHTLLQTLVGFGIGFIVLVLVGSYF